MTHTLVRDPNMLGIIFGFCDTQGNVPDEDLRAWDLSWPLLKLWHSEQISWEGITESGWWEMECFYNWLIGYHGMEPVF